MTMQEFFFLLCILQLGYSLSPNGTCSADDAQICGRCTNTACEVHNSNFIGSFASVSSAMECQNWCKQRNDYMNDCTYLTYYGNEGVPLQNLCYIFSSCDKKVSCSHCVTETFDCLCSSNVLGQIEGDNLLDEVADIATERNCQQACVKNIKCKIYTYFTDSQQCFLLSQLIEPLQDCNNCRTGRSECSAPIHWPTTSTKITSEQPTTTTNTTKRPTTYISTTQTAPTKVTTIPEITTKPTTTATISTMTTSPARACMVGFHLVPGDYPGMGQVGSYTNVSDTDECGRLCLLNTAGCRSYEYSRTERRCNLNIVDAPTKAVYKDYAFCVYPDCHWYGTAPTCEAKCPSNTVKLIKSKCGDGHECLNGNFKKLCCQKDIYRDCVWMGTAPFCDGDCHDAGPGYVTVSSSKCGDAHFCLTGHKKLCCKRK